MHIPLIEDFVHAIGNELDPVAVAAKTNVLIDAIYHSAEIGAEVTIGPGDQAEMATVC